MFTLLSLLVGACGEPESSTDRGNGAAAPVMSKDEFCSLYASDIQTVAGANGVSFDSACDSMYRGIVLNP